MKLIGIKRLIILAVLLGINVVIAGLYFIWIDPMVTNATQQLAGVNGEISNLHSKISSVRNDLEEFKRNLPKYEALKASGFMSGQDRFEASRNLDALRVKAGLAGFSFNINDVSTVKNAEAERAKMKVISSKIDVTNVSFLLDNDFYKFLALMNKDFPQQLRISSFDISRKGKIDPSSLATIRAGKMPNVLDAKATMEWITVVPLTDDAQSKTGRR